MMRQLSHIFLADGLTFISPSWLLVLVADCYRIRGSVRLPPEQKPVMTRTHRARNNPPGGSRDRNGYSNHRGGRKANR